MTKRNEPEQIELTEHDIKALHERIASQNLTEEDIILFGKVLHFFVWVQLKLSKFQITVHKLRSIMFGGKTEKRNRSKKDKDNKPSPDINTENFSDISPSSNIDAELEQKSADDVQLNVNQSACDALEKKVVKGHGRHGVTAYNPDETITYSHQTLKVGDLCPTLCGGRLYEPEPGGVIRVKGQSCAHVIKFIFNKLRCALCGDTFNPEIPSDFPKDKYDAYFKSIIAVEKYFCAVPFYRQEQYQQLMNFPLPDSTQFDLTEQVADCAYPVIGAFEQLAANGEIAHNDDTTVKILDVMKANKDDPDKERTGMFTSCIFAYTGIYKICLYYSGTLHAGENFTRILSMRDKSLPPIIQMCDALSANVSSEFKTILCNCLLHGRRKFTDIDAFFPQECAFVIDQLALVYKYDDEAKKQNMTAKQRLAHHQEFSELVMDKLKVWLRKQIDEHLVEPNSALGAAIKYMERHWEKLTRFLSVEGAPLDNNVVERALKLAIRIRKTSMFHRTRHGAAIASILLSLIYTCKLSSKNPIYYLTALQENKSRVFKNPHDWLPWNYESTLSSLMVTLKNAA